MSNDFNRDRQEWLEDVLSDARLTHATFKVAYLVASYINRQSGKAWPTQETLANRANMTDRALRPILQSLVEGGYLLCEPGRGRHKPNIYQLAHKNRKQASSFTDEKGEAGFRLSGEKTGSSASENRKFSAQKGEAGFLQNLKREPYDEHRAPAAPRVVLQERRPIRFEIISDDGPASPGLPLVAGADGNTAGVAKLVRKPKSSKQVIPDGLFQRFRAAYPRQKGSNWKTAADLFERAVKKGADPEAIIAGAAAYARQSIRDGNTGDRSKFIKLVETWLRASGWEADYGDEPQLVDAPAGLSPEQWHRTLERFRRDGAWPATFGPKPGALGCRAPAAILRELKIAGAA